MADRAAPHGRHRQTVSRLVAAIIVLGLAVGLGSPTALAQDNTTDNEQIATIELRPVGEIAGDRPNSQLDAVVSIETQRAISGRLLVVDEPFQGPSTTWEFDLDLAAGTTSSMPVMLVSGWEGVRATATLEAGGAIIAEDTLQAFPNGPGGSNIVGTLGIDEPPRRVIEIGSDQQLAVFAVDGNLGAISRVSTLVADPATLRDAVGSPIGLTINAWLRGGGQLVVDGPTESLDDSYHEQTTANPDRFLVGAGSVLYDQQWRDGVPIGGRQGSSALQRLIDEQGFGAGAAGELALIADLGLPRPGMIATVLLGYALLAGPLLYLVIARRHLHRRLWAVLPAFAVVVAAAILIVGILNGRGRTDGHITIVEVDPAGSRATTNLLIGSRFGGNRDLAVPSGWHYLGQNVGGSQRAVRLRPTANALQVSVDLPPSGNGNLRLSGPAPGYDDAIRIESITATPDGSITADFVNASGADLQGVVALLGNDRDAIGDVAAGETVSFTVQRVDRDGRLMRELTVWPRVRSDWTQNGPIARPQDLSSDDPIEAGAWTQWRIDQGTSATPNTVIGVVGWTDDLAAPIAGIERGNTALFVRTPVPDDVLGSSWVSSAYQPFNQSNPPFIDNEFFGWPQHYRFTLGPSTDVDDLSLRVGPESAGVAVQVDGTWLHAALPEADGRRSVTIALPPDAASTGEIIVRSLIPEWEWNAPQTVFIGDPSAPGGDTTEPVTVDWGDRLSLRRGNGPFFEERFPPFEQGVEIVDAELIEPLPDGGELSFSAGLGDSQALAYVVPLEVGQTLTATMRSSTGDSFLEVWVDGRVEVSNDDFGDSLDSQVVFEAVNGGIVEVRAQGLGGQAIDFDITIEVAP